MTACLRDSPVFVHTGEEENGHGGRDAFREAAAGPRRELVGEEARGAAARGVAPDGAREAALESFKKVMSGTKTITSIEDIEGFEGLDEDARTRSASRPSGTPKPCARRARCRHRRRCDALVLCYD